MRFDSVMNWGHVLTAAMILVSGCASVFADYNSVKRVNEAHGLKIDQLEHVVEVQEAAQSHLLSTVIGIREDIATIKARQLQNLSGAAQERR